eukprot:3938127-Rhodomonas_salina.3
MSMTAASCSFRGRRVVFPCRSPHAEPAQMKLIPMSGTAGQLPEGVSGSGRDIMELEGATKEPPIARYCAAIPAYGAHPRTDSLALCFQARTQMRRR